MKSLYQLLILTVFMLIFYTCKDSKDPNPIYGSWSAKYLYLDGTELLGYQDSKISYMLKPAFFSEDGKFVIFKDNQNKERIQGNFELLGYEGIDSIKIQSKENGLSDTYKINLTDQKGKLIMVLDAKNKKIYFERISASINY